MTYTEIHLIFYWRPLNGPPMRLAGGLGQRNTLTETGWEGPVGSLFPHAELMFSTLSEKNGSLAGLHIPTICFKEPLNQIGLFQGITGFLSGELCRLIVGLVVVDVVGSFPQLLDCVLSTCAYDFAETGKLPVCWYEWLLISSQACETSHSTV